MTNERQGHCLCNGVRITVTDPSHELGACHCDMCRRWTGVAFVGFGVAERNLKVEGSGNVTAFRSSDWAERCFCKVCGSTLWYHLTIPGQELTHYVAAGLLDDLSGMTLEHELFIDKKPDAFAFAGERKRTTEADFLASLSASPEE